MSSYTYDEIVKNERVSIINGSFAIVGVNIVSSFAPLFLLRALHASLQEVALYNSLPALMVIFATLIGAFWMNYVASKKWFCIHTTVAARIFYVLIALAPIFSPVPYAALAVVILIALMNVPQAFGNLSWQSLIGDLVPAERRADFFSKRNQVVTVYGMLVILIAGLLLELFPVTSAPPYQAFFIVSALASVFEIYYLVRHREHVRINTSRWRQGGLRPITFFRIFRRKNYVRFLVGSIIFNLGWQLAWPLFNIYQINDAGATALWLSVFNVVGQLSQILTFSLWGRLSQRFGNAVALALACFGVGITPVLTILSTNMLYLALVNFLTGSFVGGTNLLLLNYLLEVSPKSERTVYIAHYNVLLGVVGFAAPEIGIWLYSLFAMDATMIISTVGRMLGGVYFLWVFKRSIV